MKNSKRILALLILFVSVAMFSILPATASVLNEVQEHTTDNNGIQIEAKYKKISSYKITFNGNGGKIGTKTKVAKNINKGAKIKKFPTTPKRSGYTFKGWYTKKTSEKKISVNTKPTKSVTVYAQWTKKAKSRVLTAEEKELVGPWRGAYQGHSFYYQFRADGTYSQNIQQGGAYEGTRAVYVLQRGGWSKSRGTVYFTNTKVTSWQDTDKPPGNIAWKSISNSKMPITMHVPDDTSPVRYFRDIGRNNFKLQNDPLPNWLYV